MAENPSKGTRANGPSPSLQIRYEQTAAIHSPQFLVAVHPEGIVLDCSSGPLFEQGSSRAVLPIHTRLSIPATSVPKLVELLNYATKQFDKSKGPGRGDREPTRRSDDVPAGAGARLPKLGVPNV